MTRSRTRAKDAGYLPNYELPVLRKQRVYTGKRWHKIMKIVNATEAEEAASAARRTPTPVKDTMAQQRGRKEGGAPFKAPVTRKQGRGRKDSTTPR